MNTEQLIGLASSNSLLCDITHKYNEVKLKGEKWDKVRGELNQTGTCTHSFTFMNIY
jgi:hypothetical protein